MPEVYIIFNQVICKQGFSSNILDLIMVNNETPKQDQPTTDPEDKRYNKKKQIKAEILGHRNKLEQNTLVT